MNRILTYNVHGCIGTEGQLDPGRTAEVIASCEPDIVALQEVDVGRERSGRVDQAETIARALGMEAHFHPAVTAAGEHYGGAILTRHRAKLVKAGLLPTWTRRKELEPRGALWVCVPVGGHEVNVIGTHLGLRGRERLIQVEALLGPDWLGRAHANAPTILLGDFNAVPRSRAYRRITGHLRDAQVVAGRPRPTFPSRVPVLRLDHVFVNRAVDVLRSDTIRTPLARRASDHLPLLVEWRIASPGAVVR